MKLSDSLVFLAMLAGSFIAEITLLQENPSLEYIEHYKDIAISEMERTGIPASIKLAQGLVESGAGKSTLSTQANNHFGIKCGGGWEGATFKLKDDDYVNGKLIKSCFRKFANPYESYIEHSKFLTTQKRYRTLFNLSKQDYYAWAKGLKKAGYATDPKYADKLINIIEKYQLFQYDTAPANDILVNTDDEQNIPPDAVVIVDGTKGQTTNSTTSTGRPRTSTTKRGTARSRKSSNATTHRVREGETIASIAASYGLDATIVRLRNRIPKDAEPLAGEKINLRKKFSIFKRPKFTRTPSTRDVAVQDEFIF